MLHAAEKDTIYPATTASSWETCLAWGSFEVFMAYFNLIAAVVWLLAGVVMMAMQRANPDNPPFLVPGTGISLGWIAMLLVVYNLVRWYSIRSAARQRLLMEGSARPVQRPGEAA